MQCSFIWKYKRKITGKSQNATNNYTILKNSTEKNSKKNYKLYLTPFYG